MSTGCPYCDEEQERTLNPTALCDIHEIEFLWWTAEAALQDYVDKVKEVLQKEKGEKNNDTD